MLLYNLKLNCLIFFHQSKQLTDYIHTDIYCKLSKCIGQTLCSYEHYLVIEFLIYNPHCYYFVHICCTSYKSVKLLLLLCFRQAGKVDTGAK